MTHYNPDTLESEVNSWLSNLKPEYKNFLQSSNLANEALNHYKEVFDLYFCDECEKFRNHWKELYLNYISYMVWNAVVSYEVGVLKRNTRKNSGHNDADKLQKEFLTKFMV